MKRRVSFVSNSSSSSFIVAEEDNKFDICFSDYESMSLKQYCEHFLERDTMEWMGFSDMKIENFTFVPEQRFSKMFGRCIKKTFPNSCKDLVKDYIAIYTNRPDVKWDSKEYDDYYKKLDVVKQKIIEKCVKALQLEWKNVKFHYAEIDDNWIEDRDEDMVTLTTDKLDYIETLKELKFRRIFCNH